MLQLQVPCSWYFWALAFGFNLAMHNLKNILISVVIVSNLGKIIRTCTCLYKQDSTEHHDHIE
ncbi:hypothetical protein T01_7247 [Trichinella spiralis]|uniref:Uncharacterized protein n=1 Tax=Trichinella spiralis TaxID=6334 RepID=A0A0V1AXI0_TRISP|nr:hypothetical protein T01_7247 [Trichinella spiralis]